MRKLFWLHYGAKLAKYARSKRFMIIQRGGGGGGSKCDVIKRGEGVQNSLNLCDVIYERPLIPLHHLLLNTKTTSPYHIHLLPITTHSLLYPSNPGVTIGFDQIGYSFLENQRYARVSVRVLQGQLKKTVAVQFRTIRGSAVGRHAVTYL